MSASTRARKRETASSRRLTRPRPRLCFGSRGIVAPRPAARETAVTDTTAGRVRTVPPVRRRRSNRPGNSQANGPDGRRRSGKQPAAWCRRLTEGVTAGRPEVSFRGTSRGKSLRSSDRGGADGSVRAVASPSLDVRDPCMSELRLRRPPRDAARRAPPRARRAHGAVRRLFDAGAVPDRHHRRAQPGRGARPACSTCRTWARRCSSVPTTPTTRTRRSRR